MPTVPTVQGRQVQSVGVQVPKGGFQAFDQPNIGNVISDVGSKALGVFAEAKQQADVAQAQEGSLRLDHIGNDLTSNEKTGFMTLQGKNAIGKAPEYIQQYDDQINSIAAGITSERSRNAFLLNAQQQRMRFATELERHEFSQRQKYVEGQFQGTLVNNAKNASSMFRRNDNAAYVSLNKQTFQQIEQFGAANGWSDEQITAKKIEFKEKTAKAAAENAVGADYKQVRQQNGELSDTVSGSRRATLNPYGGDPKSTKGMVTQGNINLFNRPSVNNEDGTISTVRTISIGTDAGEVLIPTVSDDGKLLSDDDAIALYEKTGKHLGIFDNPDDATAYAEKLHDQQDQYYVKGGNGDARGIRNNNPGNLEFSNSNPWQGQAGSDGRFAKFETPEHGIRALGRNLLSYQRQGIDTVSDIINRWAPPEDNNDTGAYIQAVCAQLGVGPDQQINASDPQTLNALCAAIIKHENGNQPYSNDQISTGVNAALGINNLPTSGKRYTGTAWFDALSEGDQASVLRQTDELAKQQQSEYRSLLDERVRDASAAYLRGVEFPNAPTQADFLAGYGVREGNLRYTEFRNNQIAGQYIGSFRNLPTQSIEGVVAGLKPGTDDTGEGYAARAQTYDAVVRAAGEVIKQRQADPIQFSLDTAQAKPIDFSNDETFSKSLSLRSSQIYDLSKSFGTPVKFFSKTEARNFSTLLSQSTPDKAIDLLQQVGRSLDAQGISALQEQIGDNNPTYGALAGILAAPDNYINTRNGIGSYIDYKLTVDKYNASERILQGYRALSPSEQDKKAGIIPVAIPSDQKMLESFESLVGDSFAMATKDRQRAFGLFKAAYAGEMLNNQEIDTDDRNEAGKNINDDIANKAILYATGGVVEYRGGNVVPPYGMDEDDFKEKMDAARESAFEGIGDASGFTPIKLPSGAYGFRVGNRIATKDGQPILVEIK